MASKSAVSYLLHQILSRLCGSVTIGTVSGLDDELCPYVDHPYAVC
jgi:hypothetical protein